MMKPVQLGDGEYILTVEEKIRDCIPATIGYCIDENNGKIAGIIMKQCIKNKYLYEDADSKVYWEAAKNGLAGIEQIFLVMTFVDSKSKVFEKMNFYFDLKDPSFSNHMLEWFEMIIEKNGILELFDGSEPSIMVDTIPLDLPKLIVATRGCF
jgi:hypothetical protein